MKTFARNADGTETLLTVVTKPAAETPPNPYVGDYGAKVPVAKLALVDGRWRRVYLDFTPAASRAWVQVKGERVLIEEREAETGAELAKKDSNFLEFAVGYIECLKWSTSGNADGADVESLEDFALSDEAHAKIIEECGAFYLANRDDCAEAAARYGSAADKSGYQGVGHDFWLTRAGHGAGFWDGDLPEALGNRLTEASKTFAEVTPYIGDDGLVYV